MEEQTIWQDTPSWVSVWHWIFLVLLLGMLSMIISPLSCLFAILVAIVIWIDLKIQVYRLTSQRLFFTKGLFHNKKRFVELYRIKRFTLIQPWYYKPFDIADIKLKMLSKNDKPIILKAIHNATEVTEIIRKYTELNRDKKRVREQDFETWDLKN